MLKIILCMETKFVMPFQFPRKVYRRQAKSLLGVFDGARKFDNGLFAVLKDGVVTLYRDVSYGKERVIFSDLEDVFVASNGYILLKKKDVDEWQLYDSHLKIYAMGERVAVFQDDSYCLVFLKQKDKPQWFFYNLCKNSFLPSRKVLDADEFDVRHDKFCPLDSRLMFIVTLDGKTILQWMNMLYLKPTKILSAPYHYCLPDGCIAVAEKPFYIHEGYRVVKVMPSEGVLEIYSADFKFKYCANGLAIVGKGVILRYYDEQWSLFVGNDLIKGGIVDVQMYAGVMAYHIGVVGKTLDGKTVKVLCYKDDKVIFEYGDERFFIFLDDALAVVVQADGMDDVFVI